MAEAPGDHTTSDSQQPATDDAASQYHSHPTASIHASQQAGVTTSYSQYHNHPTASIHASQQAGATTSSSQYHGHPSASTHPPQQAGVTTSSSQYRGHPTASTRPPQQAGATMSPSQYHGHPTASTRPPQQDGVTMSSTGRDTEEYQKILTRYDTIIDQLASARCSGHLADKLRGKELITGQIYEEALNVGPGVVESTRIRPMINAVLAKVELNTKNYYTFVGVLREIEGAADIVQYIIQGISRSVLDAMEDVELPQNSEVVKSDVVAAAKAKIVQLQDEYESLVTMTQEAVQAKSPTLTEFCNKITLRLPESIRAEVEPTLKKTLPYIYNAKSIGEIFGFLNLCVWNFLNYGLLQHIVEVYGDDKLHQKMEKYIALVDSFRKKTTIEVFWEAHPASKSCPEIPSTLRESLKRVTFKHGNLDGTASLDDIERHRQNLARHVSLPDLTIILEDIKGGSVATVWLVPPSVADRLADEVQKGIVDFLEQHNILELEIQDSTVYRSKKISFTDLVFGDQVGEGAFGVVYKGHWKSRDINVAIKRVPGRINKEETEILGQLRHPNIIQFHGVVVDRPGPPEHYIVTELAERGSLYDLLYKKNYKPSQEESLQWATQIAQGMEYLHQKKMMHRDLKSSNVLLTGDGNIKICDFGGAKCFDHTTKQTQAGTYRWMAPEVMEGEPVSLSADVFSYGMLLYEIFTCKLPFSDAKSDLVVSGKIMRGEIPSIPDSVKPYLANLLKRCWDANPKARPSFHDVLEILTNRGNLRGVDVIGETILTVTNEAQDFHWAGYGLILHIPPASLPIGVERSSIEIKASLAGQYDFPSHSTLVSAVYWMRSPLVFSKPVVLEIQHCAKRAEVSSLSFVVAKCSQKHLPYQFKPLQGGVFNSSTNHGKITLSHFSGLAINCNGTEDMNTYCAMHFYLGTTINRNVDFVVTKDLKADITAVTEEYRNKGAIKGPDQDIEFETDRVLLKLEEEEPIPMGWSIKALTPLVILKKKVDSFVEGRRIPSCRLKLRWTKSQQPEELYHRVKLQGAREPLNFFIIEYDSLSAGTPTPSLVQSTQAHALEKPTDAGNTWEYKVFTQNSAEIIDKLAHVKLARRVADKLNADRIIGENVTDLAYNTGPGVVESDRVRPMIDALKDQIQLNHRRYHEFRDILLSLGPDAETALYFIPGKGPTLDEARTMKAVVPSPDQVGAPSLPSGLDRQPPKLVRRVDQRSPPRSKSSQSLTRPDSGMDQRRTPRFKPSQPLTRPDSGMDQRHSPRFKPSKPLQLDSVDPGSPPAFPYPQPTRPDIGIDQRYPTIGATPFSYGLGLQIPRLDNRVDQRPLPTFPYPQPTRPDSGMDQRHPPRFESSQPLTRPDGGMDQRHPPRFKSSQPLTRPDSGMDLRHPPRFKPSQPLQLDSMDPGPSSASLYPKPTWPGSRINQRHPTNSFPMTSS